MRTTAPPLLPLFRSAGQAELIAAIFLAPDQEHSIQDLSNRAGVAYPTAHRELSRLLQSGLVIERRVGQSRLLRANSSSPFYSALAELIEVAFGAAPLLQQTLGQLDGISAVALFGSFADRQAGNEGPAPSDIDVLVIGTPDLDAVYASCRSVSERVGRPVNPLVLNLEEWQATTDVFVQQIKNGPLQNVVGDALSLGSEHSDASHGPQESRP